MFTVEIFEQGDGVLPRDPRQFLECRHGNPVAFRFLVSGELLLQLSQRLPVKNQLRRDAHQIFLSQENLQKFLCSLGFDGKFCQHFFHRWHCETRGSKRRFDLFLGSGFFGKQGNFRSRFFYQLSLRVELLLRGQFFQRCAKSFAPHALSQAGPQILARNSRQQRIFLLKSFGLFR